MTLHIQRSLYGNRIRFTDIYVYVNNALVHTVEMHDVLYNIERRSIFLCQEGCHFILDKYVHS